MEFTISSVDYAPPELEEQVPIVVTLLRQMPGDDRPDYWLVEAATPIRWLVDNQLRLITHLVLAARWQGTQIREEANSLPVGIAYVVDQSLLTDEKLDLKKCAYVAIGLGSDTTSGRQVIPLDAIHSGQIARGFGTAHSS